jgi:hypothetical protein
MTAPRDQGPDATEVAPTTARLRETHRQEGGVLRQSLGRITAPS